VIQVLNFCLHMILVEENHAKIDLKINKAGLPGMKVGGPQEALGPKWDERGVSDRTHQK
jgi:hypothetical protein